jgi:methionine biosynthesis protein MetW
LVNLWEECRFCNGETIRIKTYPPKSFDCIILYNSLQEVKIDFVIEGVLDWKRRCIIGFPDFAYITACDRSSFWKFSSYKNLPYQWHNSPNLRFLSIKDFEDFCFEKI